MKKQVGIVVFDDVEALDFCGPFEVFSVAGEVHGGLSRMDDKRGWIDGSSPQRVEGAAGPFVCFLSRSGHPVDSREAGLPKRNGQ